MKLWTPLSMLRHAQMHRGRILAGHGGGSVANPIGNRIEKITANCADRPGGDLTGSAGPVGSPLHRARSASRSKLSSRA